MHLDFCLLFLNLIHLTLNISQDLVLVNNEELDNSETQVEDLQVSNAEVFVATDEWQEVRNGQAIPAGLHVRVNLQTGLKEAKILREENDVSTNDEGIKYDALKEALKNIKSDFKAASDEESKSEFRSIDELKSELGDAHLSVETDIQVIKRLFQQFTQAPDNDVKANIIENLEYYVHQYDNALDFIQLEGLSLIIIPSLNSTSANLRKQACFLVGGAVQSNPQFQIASLEAGFVEVFLRLTSLDPDPEVSTKAFYALSSLLRNFPEAQNTFLRQGGMGILVKIFENRSKRYERLKIKILTLIHDLMVERDSSTTFDDPVSLARKKQYQLYSFESKVQESGLCQVLNPMLILPKSDRQAKRDDILSTVSDEFPIRVEHDSIEKILGAIVSLFPSCKNDLVANFEFQSKLMFLKDQYSVLSDKERSENDGDLFFSNILEMILNLSNNIKSHKLEL